MFWDKVSRFYDLFEIVYNGKVFHGVGERVAEMMDADDVVLECACGTGAISRYIAPVCKKLTATDYSAGMLKRTAKKCRQYSNIEIKRADIMQLKVQDNYFDKVVAGNVIHLLENPQKAVKELVRVCKPGGKIIIPTYINKSSGSSRRAAKLPGFALADSMDMSEYKSKKIVVYLIIGASFMLVCFVAGLIRTGRTAVNGKNLRLPFKDRTKEEAGKIINREVAEGRTQVDEYIYDLPLGKKPYGERVILLPSYLLICHDLGGITAIPRDKIYWLCAQTGRKGQSSYIVRLQIFTELQVFGVDGVEPEYVKGIADKIYQFIPDVFSGYDPFILSYQLEELYNKNRKAFLDLYNDERRKRGEQMTGEEGV